MTKSRKKQVEQVVEPASLASLLGMEPTPVPVVEEDIKSKKLSPFDFMNAINYSKDNLIVDEETEKQYNPFIVNRGLSNSMDAVIYANEMNSRPHIFKSGQFHFLLKAVPKRKRYDKWTKREEIENLELVKEYFQYGDKKAIEALTILTEDQIGYIKLKLSKGGRE